MTRGGDSSGSRPGEHTAAAPQRSYGFRSLPAFKAKFQSGDRPLHMIYADSAALPAIANAIGRAYLPDLDAGTASRLLRHLCR